MEPAETKEKHYSFTLRDEKEIILVDTFLKALAIKDFDKIEMTKEEYKAKLEYSRSSKGSILSVEEQAELFKP